MIRHILQLAAIVLCLFVGPLTASWLVARSDSKSLSVEFPANVDGWISVAESPLSNQSSLDPELNVRSRIYRRGDNTIQINVAADMLGFGGTDRLVSENPTSNIRSSAAYAKNDRALENLEILDALHWSVEETSPDLYAIHAFWYELEDDIVKNRIEMKVKSVLAILSADSSYGIIEVTMMCYINKCAEAIITVNSFSATLIGQKATFIEAKLRNVRK